MGIFDLVKKLFMEEKAEEIVSKKLAFSEIENWIGNKRKENELEEKEILDIISEKIERFTKELREKIGVLESFDIKSKREKDHIKEVVNSSRKKYINSVEDFLEDLNNLEINSFDVMKKINKIFLDFNKEINIVQPIPFVRCRLYFIAKFPFKLTVNGFYFGHISVKCSVNYKL